MLDTVQKQDVIDRLEEALALSDPNKVIAEIKQFKTELGRKWRRIELDCEDKD